MIRQLWLTASFAPKYRKRAPIVRFSHLFTTPDRRSCDAMLEEAQATKRLQSVPFKLNNMPRNKRAILLFSAFGEMNCGKNARKNTATFGLRAFVRNPCQNIVLNFFTGITCTSLTSVLFFRNIVMPIYTRYAAPANLTTVKASC